MFATLFCIDSTVYQPQTNRFPHSLYFHQLVPTRQSAPSTGNARSTSDVLYD